MENLTLDTDFSSLTGAQSDEWILNFMALADDAFKESDDRLRLLGNLLILEQYLNTLRQELAVCGQKLSAGLERACDLLWDCLEDRTSPVDFQDFANDYFDCLYAYNTGDVSTDAPEEFYNAYFADCDPDAFELLAVEWSSGLLMQLMSIAGGRIDFDFEDFKDCKRTDFYGIAIMFNILEDACIGLIQTPSPSASHETLMAQIRQSPLFRGIVRRVQDGLQRALRAVPDEFAALREEYRQYAVLPDECAAKLLEF